MPELPEVETVKRDLTLSVLGQKIDAVRVVDARVIRGIAPNPFKSRLKGRMIRDISRRGKAIILSLDQGYYLIVQLMMTGQLVYLKTLPDVLLKETKVIFTLSNGSHLIYNDQRLFGRLSLISDLNDFKHFSLLGPEPFDQTFNSKYIREKFKQKSVAVKSVLLDHTFVAGIGNIYAAEILFRSQVDPRRRASSLKRTEINRLHQIIVEVLKEAIKYRGSSMRNYRDGQGQKGRFNERIKVYAREDEPCTSCSAPIVRIVQGGRSTFYCRNCQF